MKVWQRDTFLDPEVGPQTDKTIIVCYLYPGFVLNCNIFTFFLRTSLTGEIPKKVIHNSTNVVWCYKICVCIKDIHVIIHVIKLIRQRSQTHHAEKAQHPIYLCLVWVCCLRLCTNGSRSCLQPCLHPQWLQVMPPP